MGDIRGLLEEEKVAVHVDIFKIGLIFVAVVLGDRGFVAAGSFGLTKRGVERRVYKKLDNR